MRAWGKLPERVGGRACLPQFWCSQNAGNCNQYGNAYHSGFFKGHSLTVISDQPVVINFSIQEKSSPSLYCIIYTCIFPDTDEPIPLSLPNQWLWDIIDEFIYQVDAYVQYFHLFLIEWSIANFSHLFYFFIVLSDLMRIPFLIFS